MSHVLQLVKKQENELSNFVLGWQQATAAPELHSGHLMLMLTLYNHPQSKFHHDTTLLPWMEQAADQPLAIQFPSGCITFTDCNYDSPPDTAFFIQNMALMDNLLTKCKRAELTSIHDKIRLFLERTIPAMLTGGIHTPNHRWVMAAALAQLYEIFKDEALRDRAFAFLGEGFDMTEYGEWTERSNGLYNSVCDVHLYDVALAFDYPPALEAIRKNLDMTRYLMHDDHSLVTDYSGRQDKGTIYHFNDWFYVILHLMANHDQNYDYSAMAMAARQTAPQGSLALIYWMLHPERMILPNKDAKLQQHYTTIWGEGFMTPVPQTIPYMGMFSGHPHGASVLRHRRDALSTTIMAAQSTIASLRHGSARLLSVKLASGWFGVAGICFPTIRQTGATTYQMTVELEGHYKDVLPREQTDPAQGRYVDMPNALRAHTHSSVQPVNIDIEVLENGLEFTIDTPQTLGVLIQLVLTFDTDGQLQGEGLACRESYLYEMTGETTSFTSESGQDQIVITAPGHTKGHDYAVLRNDRHDKDYTHVILNWMTPGSRKVRIVGCSKS